MATSGCYKELKDKTIPTTIKLSSPLLMNSIGFKKTLEFPEFIDKTLLIKEIFNDKYHYLMITAPPGFGKTTNLDMVSQFVEVKINNETGIIDDTECSNNYKLFTEGPKKLLIAEELDIIEKYFGQFLVIRVSFKSIYVKSNYKFYYRRCSEMYNKLFKEHKYLLQSQGLTYENKLKISKYMNSTNLDLIEIESGIAFLARMLSEHWKNMGIFLFIDDFDAPFINIMMDGNRYITTRIEEELEITYYSMLLETLHERTINRALITGVTDVFGNTFKKIRHLKMYVYPCKNQYSSFYGVTINEMDASLKHFDFYAKDKSQILQNFRYFLYQSYGNSILNLNMLNKHIIIPTRTFILYYGHVNENPVSYYQRITESLNFSQAMRFYILRYTIEKILLKPIIMGKNELTLDLSIMRFICNHKSTGKAHKIERLMYVNCLIKFGLIKYEFIPHPSRCGAFYGLTILNEYVELVFRSEIEKFYGKTENDRLQDAANIFNSLTHRSSHHNLLLMAKILEIEYQNYFQKLKNYVTPINLYYPLLDIIAKSDYSIHVKCSKFNNFHKYGLTVTDNVGITIVLLKDSDPEVALKIALSNSPLNHCIIGKKIFLGINFDHNGKVKLGMLNNNIDIKKAVYYHA